MTGVSGNVCMSACCTSSCRSLVERRPQLGSSVFKDGSEVLLEAGHGRSVFAKRDTAATLGNFVG